MNRILQWLFACHHERTTFPIEPRRGAPRRCCYVACLDCGREFAYNWDEMAVGEELKQPQPRSWRNELAAGVSRG